MISINFAWRVKNGPEPQYFALIKGKFYEFWMTFRSGWRPNCLLVYSALIKGIFVHIRSYALFEKHLDCYSSSKDRLRANWFISSENLFQLRLRRSRTGSGNISCVARPGTHGIFWPHWFTCGRGISQSHSHSDRSFALIHISAYHQSNWCW